MTSSAFPIVGVVGLGLIGGSVARAAAALGPVIAWTQSAGTRAAVAAETDAIEVASGIEVVVAAAHIVVVATPLEVLVETITEVGAAIADRSDPPTITDVGSVKGPILAHATEVLRDPFTFVPGHPMAGTEHTGWSHADPDLFRQAAWALAVDEPVDLGRWWTVAELACRLGAEVVPVVAAEHDAAAAEVSHLPYLLGALLRDGVEGSGERSPALPANLAAGSYRGATRVVSTPGGAALGAQLARANRKSVLDAIDGFSERLRAARQAIADGDPDAMAAVYAWTAPAAFGPPERRARPAGRDELAALGRAGARIVGIDVGDVFVRERVAQDGPR